MLYSTISIHKEDFVAALTLNLPQISNAVTARMASELRDAMVALDQDDHVRAIVLTGSGDSFCSGTEIEIEPKSKLSIEGFFAHYRVADIIASVRKPVIAGVNGDAIDQGLEIALACDIRIAARRARLGLTQVRRGYIPWDGGTQRLPRVVGISWALFMLLTGSLLRTDDVLRIGLVNEVVENGQALSRAKEVALAIVGLGPISARYAKEAVYKGLDLSLEQGMRLEADLSVLLHTAKDRAEGIRSFLEKRKPEYKGG